MATEMPRLTKPCVYRRRHLYEGNVGPYATVRRQIRDLGERDRDIFGLPTLNERARFRADEETAVVISRLLLDPKWPQTSRKEIKQLDVRRGRLAALKGLDQAKWRCTSRSDKYAVARLDDLDGRLGR